MILTLIGLLAGLLFIIGDSVYIWGTVKGNVRPHRMAMGIFVIINGIDIANQAAAGASASLWMFLASAVTTLILFGLSFWHGAGGADKLDWVVLGGAVAGLVLWAILRTPVASIICSFIVVTVAMVPVFKKSYLEPWTESQFAWLMCSLASLVSAVSVGELSWKLLILPIHGFVAMFGVYLLIRFRSSRVTAPAGAPSGSESPLLAG